MCAWRCLLSRELESWSFRDAVVRMGSRSCERTSIGFGALVLKYVPDECVKRKGSPNGPPASKVDRPRGVCWHLRGVCIEILADFRPSLTAKWETASGGIAGCVSTDAGAISFSIDRFWPDFGQITISDRFPSRLRRHLVTHTVLTKRRARVSLARTRPERASLDARRVPVGRRYHRRAAPRASQLAWTTAMMTGKLMSSGASQRVLLDRRVCRTLLSRTGTRHHSRLQGNAQLMMRRTVRLLAKGRAYRQVIPTTTRNHRTCTLPAGHAMLL